MNGQIKINEAMKFITVGVGSVASDYLAYHSLMALGANMSVAKGVSYLSIALLAFIVNKRWTFESDRFIKSELLRYAAMCAFSTGVNVAVNKAVMTLFGVRLLAFLAAFGSSSIANFLGMKFFVFAQK